MAVSQDGKVIMGLIFCVIIALLAMSGWIDIFFTKNDVFKFWS